MQILVKTITKMSMKKVIFLIILLITLLSETYFAQSINKPEGTLPVELVYFVGDVVDSTVELKWGTATEVNNYGYEVLRADTFLKWESIGFEQGHGNSNSPKDYLFKDTSITTNGCYYYLLKQIDTDGKYELTRDTVKINVDYITSINEKYQTKDSTPMNFELFQNFPNPFNPETNISFTIRDQDFVTIKLYSITGEEIENIISSIVTSGTHLIKFKPKNLSSGTYIYKFSVHNKSISKKMIYIK